MRSSTNKQENIQHESQSVDIEGAVRRAARAAGEKKATDIVALDLKKIASFTEYFLICSGASARQVAAIAEAVEDELRKTGKRPLHTEGYSSAEWILLDYGDFIVHVFSNAARRFYDLERLWRDAGRLEIEEEGGTAKE
ncbi:MAG TPA: ribosome silencing factor [Blastocatellia bacterium]|nr:ribosome silencing factor [Blastocatellia bacterium]